MRIKPILITIILLMATKAFAQMPSEAADEEIDILPQTVRKSKVPIWLNLDLGFNVANCYDKGTVPFSYMGFGANARGGVTIEWSRCHVQTETQGFYTALSSPTGTAIDINHSTEFLYQCSTVKNWHFWAGGTLQGFADIKNIPMLMNASSCVSLFGNLCATGMVQYDFAFIHGGLYDLRNLLTAYAKLSLPLAGVVSRPDYSYIGNPTVSEDVVLVDNEVFAKLFPGASTEVGFYLNLRNNNRIGLSYRWDYLSTGKKGSYRYDHALHAINLSFMFSIN